MQSDRGINSQKFQHIYIATLPKQTAQWKLGHFFNFKIEGQF